MKCKFEHDGHCCNFGATQYMIECKQPCETIVTMTNADRILAMSDEELAKEMRSHAFALATCSEKAWLEWLKQPAEEEK